VIPDVIPSLSHERMMVSEYVHGTGFEELKHRDQPERDRIGEMIFRFYFGCLYRHGQFSGDPHPGNSMLLDDGRMAFPGLRTVQADAARGRRARDRGRPRDHRGRHRPDHAARDRRRVFSDPDKFNPDRVLAHFRAATSWYTCDREVTLTPEYATQVMIDMSDPRSEYFGYLRQESAPPDHIFGRRMEVLTLAVIAQLHATRQLPPDRPRVVLRGSPSTELGREEAAFYGQPVV